MNWYWKKRTHNTRTQAPFVLLRKRKFDVTMVIFIFFYRYQSRCNGASRSSHSNWMWNLLGCVRKSISSKNVKFIRANSLPKHFQPRTVTCFVMMQEYSDCHSDCMHLEFHSVSSCLACSIVRLTQLFKSTSRTKRNCSFFLLTQVFLFGEQRVRNYPQWQTIRWYGTVMFM